MNKQYLDYKLKLLNDIRLVATPLLIFCSIPVLIVTISYFLYTGLGLKNISTNDESDNSSQQYTELQNTNQELLRQIKVLEESIAEKSIIEEELANIKEAQELYELPQENLKEYYIIGVNDEVQSRKIKNILIQNNQYKNIGELNFDQPYLLDIGRGRSPHGELVIDNKIFFGLDIYNSACTYPSDYFLEEYESADECFKDSVSDYMAQGGLWIYDNEGENFKKIIGAEELVSDGELEIRSHLYYVSKVLDSGKYYYKAVFEYYISGYTRYKIYHLDPTDWSYERVYE